MGVSLSSWRAWRRHLGFTCTPVDRTNAVATDIVVVVVVVMLVDPRGYSATWQWCNSRQQDSGNDEAEGSGGASLEGLKGLSWQ